MDKITHEVRLEQWKHIVEECNKRPSGMPAYKWLADNGIKEKTYYYWLRQIRREVYEQMKSDNPGALTLPSNNSISYAEITITNSVPVNSAHITAATITTGSLNIDITEQASEEFLVRLMRAMKHAG